MPVPFFVVACSGEKADHACPAAELYQSQLFKMNLAAALRASGSPHFVRILSAKHGILRLDEVVEPYDCRWESPDSIAAHDLALTCCRFIDGDVYLLGPAEYLKKLDEASVILAAIDDECEPHPSVKAFLTHHVAEGNSGIGDQRKSARIVRETSL